MNEKLFEIKQETKEIKNARNDLAIVTEMFNVDEETKELTKRIKQHTVYGELSLYEFELLIKNKVIFYIKTGIAKTIENKIKQQVGNAYQQEMTLRALLDFARYEILYGLMPLVHTDWIRENIYVKAEGYLFYAKDKLKLLKWDVETKENLTIVKCIASDGVMEIVGEEIIQSKIDSNILEKAKTKAMRRALRRLFPIGTDEVVDEVTGEIFGQNQPQVTNNLDEIF